jgi:integrase/recombinase XerD
MHAVVSQDIAVTTPDLAVLLDSWTVHLRAESKSPETVKSYTDGVRAFLAWADRTDTPPVLDRRTVNAYVAELLGGGAAPATARARHLALRRFSAWLADEDETDRDELLGSKPPRIPTKVTPILRDDQLRALLAACSAGKDLRYRRDEAIVRLMVETGARAGEVVAITVGDVDFRNGSVVIRRGKGGKGRTVPIGPQTGRAIDRYLRLRRAHKLADLPNLWLTPKGGMTYAGLHSQLKIRARQAGIDGFHPHVLRHTAASRWLAAGGSEGGLMAVAGWSRRDMIDRYTRATASERAAEEARRLRLGDL